MVKPLASLLVIGALAACAPRPDPRVQAAQDFQSTVFDLVSRDEKRSQQLNSLRLGMTDEEVLRIAGPPSRRDTLEAGSETRREIWVYNGELKELGTLTFEGGTLTQLRVN